MVHELGRQRGMSGWGVLMLLIIIGFGSVIGLKLVPIYLESFKIDKAIEGVVSDPSVSQQSKREIIESMVRRLDIDSVERITEQNYKDYVTLTRKGKKVVLDVEYRAETRVIGNVSVAVDFVKHAEN